MSEAQPDGLQTGEGYVSTGTLPSRDEVRALIETAWQRFRDNIDGKVADYIPALAQADPSLFGIYHESEVATNVRNAGIAHLLRGYGRVYCDPDEATDVYTRQCSLLVTARDLAVMGATLASGGVNPVTGERVVSAGTGRRGPGRDGHRGEIERYRTLFKSIKLQPQ